MLASVAWICRGVIAAVFIASLSGKLRSRVAWSDFRRAAAALSGRSGRTAGLVSAVVVLGEAAVAGGLLSSATAPIAFAVAGLLLGAFTVAVLRTVRAGVVVACRCFGAASVSGWAAVVRNLLLLVICAAGAGSMLASPTTHLPLANVLACVLGIAVLAVALIRFEQLAAVVTPRL